MLSGLSGSLQAVDAANFVVLGCSLVMVCTSHTGGNGLLIYLPFSFFLFLSMGIISVLLPAFSDNFISLYFKVTLLVPSHHYKRCHKSEVMDLYYLPCFQLLIFKTVNLRFCLPSSPCDHEIAI